jgi:hypothetical protein
MSREANEQILQPADKLARSGDYSAWWDIEVELRGLGYQMARHLGPVYVMAERAINFGNALSSPVDSKSVNFALC